MQIQGQALLNQLLDNLSGFLSRDNVTVDELMSRSQVQTQIHQQSKLFANYCREHRAFCEQLITKAFLVNKFESQQQKQICSKCNDILCWANPNIISIFISSKQITESTIEQEGEERQSYLKRVVQQIDEKYQYLLYLLRYTKLDQQNIDNTSLCEIVKLLHNILQNEAKDLFVFFKNKPDFLDQMIELSFHFAGISDMLGKLVAEDVSNFRDLKQEIIERMIVNMKAVQILKSQEYVFLLDFVEILFTRNRFRNQDCEEIVAITQRLVDEDVIEFFIIKILEICTKKYQGQNADTVLCNCLQYLLLLANRVNSDDEANPHTFDKDQKKLPDPTMNFQLGSIFRNFQQLISVAPSLAYKNITRLSYFEFLLKIVDNRYFESFNFDSFSTVIHLLKAFKNEPTNGLIKIYILQLIQYCMHKIEQLSSTQALKIASALGPIQNLIKTKQSKGLIQKIIIVLSDKSQFFFNHYKSLKIKQTINKYVNIVGAQLSYVQNKKIKPKQLQFLSNYQEEAFKEALEKAQNEEEEEEGSQLDQQFQSCFPRTPAGNRNYEISWIEDKNFVISKDSESSQKNEQNELNQQSDEDSDEAKNGLLLIESANLGEKIKNEDEN